MINNTSNFMEYYSLLKKLNKKLEYRKDSIEKAGNELILNINSYLKNKNQDIYLPKLINTEFKVYEKLDLLDINESRFKLEKILSKIKEEAENKGLNIHLMCIGNPNVGLDSIGPKIGANLFNKINIKVYGTDKNSLIGRIYTTYKNILQNNKKSIIICLDASAVKDKKNINTISIVSEKCYPASALRTNNAGIGHYFIGCSLSTVDKPLNKDFSKDAYCKMEKIITDAFISTF